MERETDVVAAVSEQAAHWWVLLRDEGASAADHRAFGEWAARGPDRVEAYLRVAQLQRALEGKKLRWPATSREQLIREARSAPEDVVPLRQTTGAGASVSGERLRRPGPRIVFALAASVLIAAGLSWAWLTRPQHFQTAFGEQRSILLSDGSKVTLNSASKIAVQLRKDRRHVYLEEGEALFEVAHDSARPFDVQTEQAVLRAVGTQFDVDRRPGRTIVTIVEGRVLMVSAGSRDQAAGQPLLVAADRIVITDEGAQDLRHSINVPAAIAWTQRQLIFEHRPLGEVAEEFNRYNHDRIEIRSEILRAQEVSGTFQSNDAASFVSFLSSIPGVQVTEEAGDRHVVTFDESSETRE